MKITVLGAAGNVGRRVIAEALSRGHDVTAVVRNPVRIDALPATANAVVADASDVATIASISTGQDLVISALRPEPGDTPDPTTQAVLDGLAQTGTRLLVIGGAATLVIPGTGGRTVVEDAAFLPETARHIGQASANQQAVCQAEKRVDWAYLSPAAQLGAGERTGKYRLGMDELVVDDQGVSTISMEDLAVVLLDEAEHPRHHQVRFTAAY